MDLLKVVFEREFGRLFSVLTCCMHAAALAQGVLGMHIMGHDWQ